MPKVIQTESLFQLTQTGFKKIPGFNFLFINQTGSVYSFKTGKYLKQNSRNYIKQQNQYLSVPKLILQVFSGQIYKSGHVIRVDGNKLNLTPQNLKYANLSEQNTRHKVNPIDLKNAIRCYFRVEKKYKVKDTSQTRRYLQAITEKRRFLDERNGMKYIEVFKTYLKGTENNITKTAKAHELTVLDCANIVNNFKNILIDDVLYEFKTGLLHRHGYANKELTLTEAIRRWNKYTKEYGIKPISLRKPSQKEKIKSFEKFVAEF